MTFVELWRWDGRVRRKTYAIVGVIGFAIKHNIDRLIAAKFLLPGTPNGFWYLFVYWAPLGNAARLNQLSAIEVKFLTEMLLVALPFVWVGLATTVRRLRDAGQPVWLVILFFAPYVNLLFFAALCALPSRGQPVSREAAPWPETRALDSMIPRSALGSAAVSIALASVMGLAFARAGMLYLGAYGWSLFLALPFCLGLFSVMVYSYHGKRTLGTCMQVALLPVGVLAFLLVAVAVEGIICVAMAAPLALPLAALGGWAGYLIQSNHWSTKNAPAMMSIVLLIAPMLFGVEHAAGLKVPRFVVRTAIEVNAPPEVVWREVVAFAEIPPPTEMLFRAGIAYPIRAEIAGRGPGAVRHCIFSTGAFVEPIEVWDEPRLLKFGVTASPAPLNELSLYGHIETAHLHGYFASQEGQFLLTPLPDGGTRLEGTTWYQDAIWPSAYWRVWSDYIIHRIHLRVLSHIKTQIEAQK